MKRRLSSLSILSASALVYAAPAWSQASPAPAASSDYVAALKLCQTITADDQRLVCYDAAVGRVVAASDGGEVRIVDREDVRTTRRGLFGFSLPKLGIFGSNDSSDETVNVLTSQITSVHYGQTKVITFVIAEGDAVWQISNPPMRLQRIKQGDTVEFEKAALDTYWVRINGQLGVKGRRIK